MKGHSLTEPATLSFIEHWVMTPTIKRQCAELRLIVLVTMISVFHELNCGTLRQRI